jgi:hypothetical protein
MILRKAVTPSQAYDVRWVIEHMREADRDEVYPLRLDDDPESIINEILGCPYFAWLFYQGRVAAGVLGAFPCSNDIWDVFMIATHHFGQVAYPMTEFIRHDMIPLLAATGVRRAQCMSLATHEQAHRWLAFLGAEPAETLSDYGRNGESYIRYVWRGDDVLRRQQAS